MGEQTRPQSNSILKLDEQGKITVKGKPSGKNTNRNIKSILQKNYTRPKSITYWNNHFGKILPWKDIWENLENSNCKNKIKDFQWKRIHNVLNTNAKLKKNKKGS
jgi:hypothetical protein